MFAFSAAEKQMFAGEVASVVLPGINGSFGILNSHAPLISALAKGQVKVNSANQESQMFEINGGVVEVLNNKVIVLAEYALLFKPIH